MKYINNPNNYEVTNNNEEELLDTWDTFWEALNEAVTLVQPYDAKLPKHLKAKEEGHQKKVKDRRLKSEDKEGHNDDNAGK
jgi:hypothetical protein